LQAVERDSDLFGSRMVYLRLLWRCIICQVSGRN
ncbi:MAG: hypothetical protein ACI8Q1_003664, partial [Parvicella sp.]